MSKKASNPSNALRNANKKLRVFEDKYPHGYEQDPNYQALVDQQAKAKDVYDKSLLNKMSDDEFMDHAHATNVQLAEQVAAQAAAQAAQIAAEAKTAKNKRKRDKQKEIKKQKKRQAIVDEQEKIREIIAHKLVLQLGAEATTILNTHTAALKKWKRMARRTCTKNYRAKLCK